MKNWTIVQSDVIPIPNQLAIGKLIEYDETNNFTPPVPRPFLIRDGGGEDRKE